MKLRQFREITARYSADTELLVEAVDDGTRHPVDHLEDDRAGLCLVPAMVKTTRFKRLRMHLGLAQIDIVNRSRLSKSEVSRLESGALKGTSKRHREQLSKAFQIPALDIGLYLDGEQSLEQLAEFRWEYDKTITKCSAIGVDKASVPVEPDGEGWELVNVNYMGGSANEFWFWWKRRVR